MPIGATTAPTAAPVARFVEDRCAVGTMKTVPVSDLFAAWTAWAAEQDEWPGAMNVFARRLREAVPGAVIYRPRDNGQRVPRLYRGLTLR